MSISSKLLQVNQVKQDIKTAIETKGVPMTNVAFAEYANKILDISGGVVDEYYYYAKSYYTITNNATLFSNAWQDSQDSKTVLYDIPLVLAAPNQEMGGMTVDIYVGTNGELERLYNDCANNVLPQPDLEGLEHEIETYYVNDVATFYGGDRSGEVGFPIPLYSFGNSNSYVGEGFSVADITPLQMGLGIALAKYANVSIPNNNIVIQQGFKYENENGIIIPDSITSIADWAFITQDSNNQPLVIPNSVTSIGRSAFRGWTSNTHPLVIPNSVTSIGEYAFYYWQSNTQPLVIPNSVTSIGNNAFRNWTSNNQPLVIPNSVTSIGNYAFYSWTSNDQPLVIPNSVTSIGNNAFDSWLLVPYVKIKAIIPPSLASANAFSGQNNAPIYVPDESVDDYKTATQWVLLADRIFSINDK